jgi:hypothetical protein
MYRDLYDTDQENSLESSACSKRVDADDSELISIYGWPVTEVVAEILGRIAIRDTSLYTTTDSLNPYALNEADCPSYESLIERWAPK